MRKTKIAGLVLGALGLLGATTTVAVAGHATFTDTSGNTHEPGIHYVAEAGITTGCNATQYCPGTPVSRGQMATFMHRLSGNASTPPSVNAARLDGLTAAEISPAWYQVGAVMTDGIGLVMCEQGDVAVSGGYLFDGAYLMIGEGVAFDPESGREGYVVGAFDPMTGTGGTGEVEVNCQTFSSSPNSVSAHSAAPQPQYSKAQKEEILRSGRDALGALRNATR